MNRGQEDLVNEDVKHLAGAFRKEWNKYGDSGICDSAGREAIADWFHEALTGKFKPLSFMWMSGYDCHKPSDECPYSKGQIAKAMTRVARPLLKELKRSANRHYVPLNNQRLSGAFNWAG